MEEFTRCSFGQLKVGARGSIFKFLINQIPCIYFCPHIVSSGLCKLFNEETLAVDYFMGSLEPICIFYFIAFCLCYSQIILNYF